MNEGMYLVRLEGVRTTGTTSWGDPQNETVTMTRYAQRFEMATGSESILADASLELGGALTWEIRHDDLLAADPPTAGWRLHDIQAGEEYEVFSVTDRRVRGGERRLRLHTKLAARP